MLCKCPCQTKLSILLVKNVVQYIPSLIKVQFESNCFSACRWYRPSVHSAALVSVTIAVPTRNSKLSNSNPGISSITSWHLVNIKRMCRRFLPSGLTTCGKVSKKLSLKCLAHLWNQLSWYWKRQRNPCLVFDQMDSTCRLGDPGFQIALQQSLRECVLKFDNKLGSHRLALSRSGSKGLRVQTERGGVFWKGLLIYRPLHFFLFVVLVLILTCFHFFDSFHFIPAEPLKPEINSLLRSHKARYSFCKL